ncbi:MAG: retron Ec67 family RNA-directed DNA polymerase/endonuclease [Asticcacaulis sp.]|uniref:retron Ec67 family RNA-directed DNA polymerase/endonuclease n=1 Tax=Asticcacaulis sp. TaxID=1872648 RepID=UPI0039E48B59
MSKLKALKAATTLIDFAALLDTPTSTLIHTLYKKPEASKYKTFSIPKKSGGDRTIHAPIGKLKIYQHELAQLLADCRDEINAEKPRKPLSHGFRRGLSIISNAHQHKNRRFVLNLDIADYFPTFNFGRVRGFFIKNGEFELSPECATIIAQIACFQGALPQGSPCSPVIADLITHILDVRLAKLAKQNGATYSRYADDLTFSTNAKTFPPGLATGGASPEDPWLLAEQLVSRIAGAGFNINHDKTRMQAKASRQMVTGLTVNEKVNISQSYWRGARTMCHSLFKTGSFYLPSSIIEGEEPKPIDNRKILRGILGHIYHVKNKSPIKPANKRKDFFFGQKLHEDFWFYDYFIALDRPLIVPEGPTDTIYLRNAIQRLAVSHPLLGKLSGKEFKYGIGFFSYENAANKILRVAGGSDQLKTLVNSYGSRLKKYGHKPLAHPVIILLDNDAGLSEFSKAIENGYGKIISITTTDDFYHLTDNLYVVKTPEIGVGGQSAIENMFDNTTLSIPLGGKVLHLNKKTFDETKHIGKVPFAKKVVPAHAGTISWAGFDPLLKRIEAAIAHYKTL